MNIVAGGLATPTPPQKFENGLLLRGSHGITAILVSFAMIYRILQIKHSRFEGGLNLAENPTISGIFPTGYCYLKYAEVKLKIMLKR